MKKNINPQNPAAQEPVLNSPLPTGKPVPILRDSLAVDRTRLANQRTLLAFSRTGLYLVATALAIFQFSKTSRFFWTGWLLIVMGGGVVILGIINFVFMHRKIKKAYDSAIE